MSETRPASCMPHSCFCEEIRSDGIRQPANSVSSLAFVLVAALMLYRGWNTQRATAALFAVTLIFVGIGSAWFHATLSFTAQFFDVLGMYLIATLALVLSASRSRRPTHATMASLYLGMNAVLGLILYLAPVYRRWIFAALLALIIVFEILGPARGRRSLMKAIGVMGVAFVIWILDFNRILCSPSSLIQGHAAWHLLGALAAWYLFLHYTRERTSTAGAHS